MECGLDHKDDQLREYERRKREKANAAKSGTNLDQVPDVNPKEAYLQKIVDGEAIDEDKLVLEFESSIVPPIPESHHNDTNYRRAVTTYRKIIPCLLRNKYAHDGRLSHLMPSTDLKEHYNELVEKTKIFRGFPPHSYHYDGPWIGMHILSMDSILVYSFYCSFQKIISSKTLCRSPSNTSMVLFPCLFNLLTFM